MDINKVKVISFTIRNRLLGYHLLKNPKGTSPYQVKMIKTWSGISDDLDRFEHYHTKSRNFAKRNEKVEKQTLLITRYMFWKDKNNKKTVKEAVYYGNKANGESVYKEKEAGLSYEEISSRDTSYIHKEHKKGYHRELIPFLFIPVEHSVPTIESIADREIFNFFKQKYTNDTQRYTKSFWTILRQNLNNQ